MTAPRSAPTLRAGSIDAAVGELRARGLRISAARRLVLEALFAADEPLSAKCIAGGLGGRIARSDAASVYRNLEIFEQLGLVRHVHLGHGPSLYTLANAHAFGYLVCETCDDVRTCEPPQLEGVRAEVRALSGFEARFDHFPIVGRCASCATNASE